MSKQYLTAHSVDDLPKATDVFSLAVTRSSLLSVSGSSNVQVHSTTAESFPRTQTISNAHKLGAHHVATSADGSKAVTVGFGGDVRLWKYSAADSDSAWEPAGTLPDAPGANAREIWAVSLSDEGRYLAATTADGRCLVWDLWGSSPDAGSDAEMLDGTAPAMIREFETKGSFGLCVDMSPDGTLTATGHKSGNVYVFANGTGRLAHALPSLHAPVRTVRFSPAGTLLAAAGDSCVVSLHSSTSAMPVAQLAGHDAWIFSLDFSPTGERLASAAWDGRVKVWSVERRECVWTGRGADDGGAGPLWSVRFLRETRAGQYGALGRCEGFVVGGRQGLVKIFREAAGGGAGPAA